MIVEIIYAERIAVSETKDHSPVSPDSNQLVRYWIPFSAGRACPRHRDARGRSLFAKLEADIRRRGSGCAVRIFEFRLPIAAGVPNLATKASGSKHVLEWAGRRPLLRSYTARYLFSGFLKCGLCGSNIVLISGRGGVGWAMYGCPLYQNRGMCANALVVRRDRIEQELISGLQREVLREDVAAFTLEEFKGQLRARLEETRSHLEVMRNKREKLKAETANLARAIAEGIDRPRCSMNSGSARGNSTISAKL
jgi:Recombinase zinc beta ribbon domain